MPFTPYESIDELIGYLLGQMQNALGDNLRSLYLFGSLVYGDLDWRSSDIDLLAVTATDINPQEFERLDAMHRDLIARNPMWDDRIEIAYLSIPALKTFRYQSSPIGIISPGEPFHIKDAGKDWLVNWWMVRERGVTVFGPPPSTFIDPISNDEFVQWVREHAVMWRERVYEARHRKGQAYAILTLCRALYAHTHGEQVSKKRAAEWVQAQMPQWAPLIRDALTWRVAPREEDAAADHAATYPEAVRFVHFIIDQIVGPQGAG